MQRQSAASKANNKLSYIKKGYQRSMKDIGYEDRLLKLNVFT